MANVQESRRDFLKITGLTGLSLILGCSGLGDGKPVTDKIDAASLELELNPFIIIDTSGKVTIVNSRPDMGQGTTQAVPAMVAEELEVNFDDITVIPSKGNPRHGSQQSGGSSSIRNLWIPLRTSGAAAREMLISAAAAKWSVSAADCYAKEGKVYLKSGEESFHYGELVEEAAKLPVPQNPGLKDPKDFKILGRYKKRPDIGSKVNGKAIFGMDTEVPGMVYACILHPPAIHSKIISVDDTEALKVKGVLRVLRSERHMPHRDSETVAVVATNWWAALKGRKALNVTWDPQDYEKSMDTEWYIQELYDQKEKEGILYEEKGNFREALKESSTVLKTIYETPFLAHTPIEPVTAVVHVKEDGTVDVWAHVQGPDEGIKQLAAYLSIDPDKINFTVPLLGGSFGRKAYLDYLFEAAHVSRELKKPVKMIWTREDDITQGPYRPGMLSIMEGAVKDDKITACSHHPVGESIVGQLYSVNTPYDPANDWLMGDLTNGKQGYAIPNQKVSWTNVKTDLPIVWWRSVYASNFGFGQECFLDELAFAANKDPLEARKELLKDSPRHLKVLEIIEEKAKWNKNLPQHKGQGIGMFSSFGSISACCITLSKQDKGVKIEKVISVIDCGLYVNPDTVKAQTEGNIIMGLTAAIKNGISFTNGRCDQTNFHQYQLMRINEVPEIETFIIDSGAKPGGVGEPGLPPVAPALVNAVFAVTGKRIRKLPFDIATV